MAKKTIKGAFPVRWMTQDGKPGKDGVGSYDLQLSADSVLIALDAEMHPSALSVTTEVNIGVSHANATITSLTKTDPSYPSGMTVVLSGSGNNRKMTVTAQQSATFSEGAKYLVTLNATLAIQDSSGTWTHNITKQISIIAQQPGAKGADAYTLSVTGQFGMMKVSQSGTYPNRFYLQETKAVTIRLMEGASPKSTSAWTGSSNGMYGYSLTDNGVCTITLTANQSYLIGAATTREGVYVCPTYASFTVNCTYNSTVYSVNIPVEIDTSAQFVSLNNDMQGFQQDVYNLNGDITTIRQTATAFSFKLGELERMYADNLIANGYINMCFNNSSPTMQLRKVSLSTGRYYAYAVHGGRYGTAQIGGTDNYSAYLYSPSSVKLDGYKDKGGTTRTMVQDFSDTPVNTGKTVFTLVQATSSDTYSLRPIAGIGEAMFLNWFVLVDVTDALNNAGGVYWRTEGTHTGAYIGERGGLTLESWLQEIITGFTHNKDDAAAQSNMLGGKTISNPQLISLQKDVSAPVEGIEVYKMDLQGSYTDYEYVFYDSIIANETYTLSLYSKLVGSASNPKVTLYFYNTSSDYPCLGRYSSTADTNRYYYNASGFDGAAVHTITSDWKILQATFTTRRNATLSAPVRILVRVYAPVYVCDLKLQKYGEAATISLSRKDLLDTGIDITNRKILCTADNFEIQNNSGDKTFGVNEAGDLVAGGSIVAGANGESGIQIIDEQGQPVITGWVMDGGVKTVLYRIGYNELFRFYDSLINVRLGGLSITSTATGSTATIAVASFTATVVNDSDMDVVIESRNDFGVWFEDPFIEKLERTPQAAYAAAPERFPKTIAAHSSQGIVFDGVSISYTGEGLVGRYSGQMGCWVVLNGRQKNDMMLYVG
ncbi:MAG: hypothetical protein HUK08_00380 [Bacteroidaceae bacterium]|nr:hypothetical protein [Bacteroidaceae bacterium]